VTSTKNGRKGVSIPKSTGKSRERQMRGERVNGENPTCLLKKSGPRARNKGAGPFVEKDVQTKKNIRLNVLDPMPGKVPPAGQKQRGVYCGTNNQT